MDAILFLLKCDKNHKELHTPFEFNIFTITCPLTIRKSIDKTLFVHLSDGDILFKQPRRGCQAISLCLWVLCSFTYRQTGGISDAISFIQSIGPITLLISRIIMKMFWFFLSTVLFCLSLGEPRIYGAERKKKILMDVSEKSERQRSISSVHHWQCALWTDCLLASALVKWMTWR